MAKNGTPDDAPTDHVNIPPGAPFAVIWEDPESGQVKLQHNVRKRKDLYGLLEMARDVECVNATIQALQARAQQAQGEKGGILRPPPGLRMD